MWNNYIFTIFLILILHFCRYPWCLKDFELGSRLGRGKFGRVFIAKEKKTGYIVALKTMSKKEIASGHAERQTLREIEIQTHLKYIFSLNVMNEYYIY